jgi:hypothetical protein
VAEPDGNRFFGDFVAHRQHRAPVSRRPPRKPWAVRFVALATRGNRPGHPESGWTTEPALSVDVESRDARYRS